MVGEVYTVKPLLSRRLGIRGCMPITEICPYLRIQYKCIGYNRPHPLYCPQFLQDQHKIGQISFLVELGRCPDNRSPDKRGLTN